VRGAQTSLHSSSFYFHTSIWRCAPGIQICSGRGPPVASQSIARLTMFRICANHQSARARRLRDASPFDIDCLPLMPSSSCSLFIFTLSFFSIITSRVGQMLSKVEWNREYVENANWNLRPQTPKVVGRKFRAFGLSQPSAMQVRWLVCVKYTLPRKCFRPEAENCGRDARAPHPNCIVPAKRVCRIVPRHPDTPRFNLSNP